MTKKIPIRKVTKTQATVYLSKAEQFYRTMKEAQENEDWDAVGLNAIHCVISANDALLGTLHGFRPAGGSHSETAELLGQYEHSEQSKRSIVRLDRMVKKKNLVEYEGRSLTPSEARKLSTDADRFLSWVRSRLGQP